MAALIDIVMPGMDGYQVVRELRSQAGMEGVLMLTVTGYGNADEVWRSLAADFDRHHTKPVDNDVLKEILDLHAMVFAENRDDDNEGDSPDPILGTSTALPSATHDGVI